MENYSFFTLDVETTSLSLIDGDIIELSIFKMSDGTQKTWCLKPLNPDKIDLGALKVNNHKLDDLLWKTKEGREKYLEPSDVLVEVENWIADDNLPAERHCIIGHNAGFDKQRLEFLWEKCGAQDSFPFGRRYIDTMILELAFDYAKGQFAEGYGLKNLTKKYGVKNERAHSAASDTIATKQVFDNQIEYLQKLIK
jgi:DNA polymerase III alpha subunit (gram-positive type)